MSDKKPHLWKKGQSGNPNGRPKAAKSRFNLTVEELKMVNDIENLRVFYRAVLASDMVALERFGIKKAPTEVSKIKAAQELVKLNEKMVSIEEEHLSKQVKIKPVATPEKATFQPVASIKTGTK